jgi:hypothetical protein
LAHGRLRFGHLVNGFTLAGSVLIETVRVLSQIAEKVENVICFNQCYTQDLPPSYYFKPYGQVNLKGYAEEVTLVRYYRQQPLKQLLENLTPFTIKALTYYRSNRDLSDILIRVRSQISNLGEDNILGVIEVLRQFKITQFKSLLVTTEKFRVAEELLNLIAALVTEYQRTEMALTENHLAVQKRSTHTLSAACRLMVNLMTPEEFDYYFEARILKLLDHKDHRVVANVIDVLIFYRNTKWDQIVRKMMTHPNGRVSTNAAVYEGYREITPEVTGYLKKALASNKGSLVTGALYAIGEIAQHHRVSDPVYYNTQVEFRHLTREVLQFKNSPVEEVSRQANLALNKIGNDALGESHWHQDLFKVKLWPRFKKKKNLSSCS